MRHKFGTIVFAQGWLEGQIENAVKAVKEDEDPTAHLVASQVQEQWTIVSEGLDDLIKENQEMDRKLRLVQSALV